jgi:orotate phosphoribosyltransferase
MTSSMSGSERQQEKEWPAEAKPRPGQIVSLEDLRTEIIFRHILRSDVQYSSNSPWYLDLKPLLLRPDSLRLVARLFWDSCSVFWPFQLCGIELGGITALTAILLEGAKRGFNVNAFVVRKEKKSYGTGRILEGIPCELPVICIDDLHNSGRSMERVSQIIGTVGLKLAALFTMVDFESGRGKQWRDVNQVPVISLFN